MPQWLETTKSVSSTCCVSVMGWRSHLRDPGWQRRISAYASWIATADRGLWLRKTLALQASAHCEASLPCIFYWPASHTTMGKLSRVGEICLFHSDREKTLNMYQWLYSQPPSLQKHLMDAVEPAGTRPESLVNCIDIALRACWCVFLSLCLCADVYDFCLCLPLSPSLPCLSSSLPPSLSRCYFPSEKGGLDMSFCVTWWYKETVISSAPVPWITSTSAVPRSSTVTCHLIQ